MTTCRFASLSAR